MLTWNEQTIKNCKSDCIVAVSDGMETYYADAEGLSARQAKADFISQCDAETDWSDAEVYFLPIHAPKRMKPAMRGKMIMVGIFITWSHYDLEAPQAEDSPADTDQFCVGECA